MLAPILDPLHRAAEEPRRQRHHDLFGIDQILGSETAADIGRDDAQLFVVHVEQLNKR